MVCCLAIRYSFILNQARQLPGNFAVLSRLGEALRRSLANGPYNG